MPAFARELPVHRDAQAGEQGDQQVLQPVQQQHVRRRPAEAEHANERDRVRDQYNEEAGHAPEHAGRGWIPCSWQRHLHPSKYRSFDQRQDVRLACCHADRKSGVTAIVRAAVVSHPVRMSRRNPGGPKATEYQRPGVPTGPRRDCD